MAKYTSEDIKRLAERLKAVRKRGDHAAHFLIGAGCSITAGIPGAMDFVKEIQQTYPEHCAELASDLENPYGSHMALLSIRERSRLIQPYLTNSRINWGAIALAQLIKEGFVERVLTLNFDPVLQNACGLLALQPSVYDFGVAPADDPALIVSPAIVHLHGQSYGLVRLNTDEETRNHRDKLEPVLVDTLRNAPLIVIGYSGSADGIFQTLMANFVGQNALYWAGYREDMPQHLHGFLGKRMFHYLGGADFDRFMLDLARTLGCWPPGLFADPLGHLLRSLSPLVEYPAGNSDGALDILVDLRRKLASLQQKLTTEERQTASLQELYMKGDYAGAARMYASSGDRATDEDRDIAYWAYIDWGNQLSEQARRASQDKASQALAAAAEKYEKALEIKQNHHVALNNLGYLLMEEVRRAGDEEVPALTDAARKRFEASLASKSDYHLALINLGSLLAGQAQRAEPAQRSKLFERAVKKFEAALAAKPDSHDALYGWGGVLSEQSKSAHGKEADELRRLARDKLKAAAELAPSKAYNLACVYALQNDEIECRTNLENAEKADSLPPPEHLAKDPDLDSMRNKQWFHELVDRQKRKH